MAARWYVIHTHSGCEVRAKRSLEERVESMGLGERVYDVLVPTERVVEMRDGKKRVMQRKFLPGYLLVQMELDDETWHLVKNTPRITGFVGNMRNPPPVPDNEVARITDRMSDGEAAPRPVMHYERGETVNLIDGSFATMKGVVDEADELRGKLRVIVNILGRPTAVELDYSQVEKVS